MDRMRLGRQSARIAVRKRLEASDLDSWRMGRGCISLDSIMIPWSLAYLLATPWHSARLRLSSGRVQSTQFLSANSGKDAKQAKKTRYLNFLKCTSSFLRKTRPAQSSLIGHWYHSTSHSRTMMLRSFLIVPLRAINHHTLPWVGSI